MKNDATCQESSCELLVIKKKRGDKNAAASDLTDFCFFSISAA